MIPLEVEAVRRIGRPVQWNGVGLAKRQRLTAFQRSTVWIERASGAVLILPGLYLGYISLAAGM